MFLLESPHCHSWLQISQSYPGEQFHYQLFACTVRFAFTFPLQLLQDQWNQRKQFTALHQFEDIAERLIEPTDEEIVSRVSACLLETLKNKIDVEGKYSSLLNIGAGEELTKEEGSSLSHFGEGMQVELANFDHHIHDFSSSVSILSREGNDSRIDDFEVEGHQCDHSQP